MYTIPAVISKYFSPNFSCQARYLTTRRLDVLTSCLYEQQLLSTFSLANMKTDFRRFCFSLNIFLLETSCFYYIHKQTESKFTIFSKGDVNLQSTFTQQ